MSFWYSSDDDVVEFTTSSPPSAGHRAQLIMRQNPPPPPAWSTHIAPGTRAPTAAARQRIIQQGQGASASPRQPVQLRASVSFWLYKLPGLGNKASLQNLGPNITTVITPRWVAGFHDFVKRDFIPALPDLSLYLPALDDKYLLARSVTGSSPLLLDKKLDVVQEMRDLCSHFIKKKVLGEVEIQIHVIIARQAERLEEEIDNDRTPAAVPDDINIKQEPEDDIREPSIASTIDLPIFDYGYRSPSPPVATASSTRGAPPAPPAATASPAKGGIPATGTASSHGIDCQEIIPAPA
ncbi:uncharacterized protein PFLUO_LOCUS14 [Penicillium psychrofluorescens]|uniref:uncharacterized protein n=1 Tax=Penicillium psychrofluorescens TaxID=3158075 RepID=UPI003CCDCF3F